MENPLDWAELEVCDTTLCHRAEKKRPSYRQPLLQLYMLHASFKARNRLFLQTLQRSQSMNDMLTMVSRVRGSTCRERKQPCQLLILFRHTLIERSGVKGEL